MLFRSIDTAQLKAVGIDASTTFLATGGDVDSLYEPAFKTLQVLTLAIPQPGGALVSAGVSVAKIGTDAVRDTIKLAFRSAGQYLPLSVSEKVIKDLSQNPGDWWLRASRDKFAQYANESLLTAAAVAAYNKFAPPSSQLNIGIRSRTADKMYETAKKYGAKDWEAAMAAWKLAWNTGAAEAKANYASIVGNVGDPEAAWKQKVGQIGGAITDATTAPLVAPTIGGMSTTTLALVGAAGVVALLLLTRKKGVPANA